MMPSFDAAEAEAAVALLPDFPSLRLGAEILPAWLDELERSEQASLVAFVGDRAVGGLERHGRLARSLNAQGHVFEHRLATHLGDVARELATATALRVPLWAEAPVVEDRPGRAQPLALEEMSVKHQLKRWTTVPSGKTEDRAPIVAETGFGVGGALFVPAEAVGVEPAVGSGRRIFNIASLDLRFPGGDLELAMLSRLYGFAETWLADIGAPPLIEQQHLYVAVPSMAVAWAVVEALTAGNKARPLVQVPDYLFGWHPSLTCLEMLAVAPLPALFVHTGRFPSVHLVAVW
jgi:hypothetical protein